MKERIIELLKGTQLKGIDELINAMEEGGFFTSACSTNHHLAKEGGLAEHSLNVFQALVKLDAAFEADLDYTEMVIAALLHDLGKMGQFGKANYIPAPPLKSGKVPAKPFISNPELMYEEHEIRSVVIASKYIELTENEQSAILHHNGLYGKLDSSFSSYYDRDKLSFLLHTADMYCSRFEEVAADE